MLGRYPPGELTLESFARNLFNDECKQNNYEGDWSRVWVELTADERRRYRRLAWLLYAEHVEQAKAGVYDGKSTVHVK